MVHLGSLVTTAPDNTLGRRSGWRALWRLVPYARPHLGRLLLATLAMGVLALATGLYAFLVGPALRFLLTGGASALGRVASWAPALEAAGRDRLLLSLPLVLIAVALVKGVAYAAQFTWTGQFGQRTVVWLRRGLLDALLRQSPVQLAGRMSGDLLSRFSADVNAVETAAIYAVGSWIRDGLQILVLSAVAVSLEWRLALVALAVVPVAGFPVSRLTRSVLRRTREGQVRLGGMAGQLREALAAVRTVQAYGVEAAEAARFSARAEAHAATLARAAWARAAVPAVTEVLAALAVAGVLVWAGGMQVAPERLLSFLAALILLYQPAKELGRASQFATQGAAAAERLLEVLETPPLVTDAPGAKAAPRLVRSVRFDTVSLSYGDRPALSRLELEIPVGKATALVGPSGGGKSTVAALLLRFVRPDAGRILWDGVDVEACTVASLRSQVALVTQEPLLFSGTVRENLLAVRPEATGGELRSALRAARAEEFVMALPRQWDTPLGERGSRLSGGQRQRLALARAVLREARLLVLDEATSNLDPEGEREVQVALEAVLPGRTALVIAHRLETTARADRIHVLVAGRVVEEGTHAELLLHGGWYAEAWSLQHPPPAATGTSR
ncbi:MAG TPA: ABC transporter ATP-binding protein [Myxococcaceae bacterium]|nr:ABC transporter ATP-binding protein [Myxococcaceae bacterium]